MNDWGARAGEILTAAQMRALEQAMIESGRVTGLELMERAGAGVVAALRAAYPDTQAAVILCGPGNNGGDGYVVARLLRDLGWRVAIFATSAPRTADATVNAECWRAGGGTVGDATDAQAMADALAGGAVLIDALLGVGQGRDPSAMLAPVHQALKAGPVACVSVDVPTGYDSDSGAALCPAPFPAGLSVTFHSEKPVHRLLRANGQGVAVVDIGL